MPEGPEIRTSALYVNNICNNITFTGSPEKSSVSKNHPVAFESQKYTISSESRGKEIALILDCHDCPERKKRILFRFGMSGKFKFTPINELPKHSHLIFHTLEPSGMALSFVDPRRFGSWHETDSWGNGRGPDPVLDVFNKPICEVMLNQKYFNGIGNYLRAEILYRAGIPPFTPARDALNQDSISEGQDDPQSILYLCCHVQKEVVNLKIGLGKTEDHYVSEDDYRAFMNWLQCYENPQMNNLVDHNGRTIWFDVSEGEPGLLVPKVRKSRGRKRKRNDSTEGGMSSTRTHSVKDEKIALGETIQRSKRPRNSREKAVVVKASDVRKTSDSVTMMQISRHTGMLTRSQVKKLLEMN